MVSRLWLLQLRPRGRESGYGLGERPTRFPCFRAPLPVSDGPLMVRSQDCGFVPLEPPSQHQSQRLDTELERQERFTD